MLSADVCTLLVCSANILIHFSPRPTGSAPGGPTVLKRAKASATLLSRRARGFVARSKFLRELRAAIFLQSVERGRRHRCEAKAQRQDLLTRMRRHVTVLWDLAHVPLAYRSRFWTLFGKSLLASTLETFAR